MTQLAKFAPMVAIFGLIGSVVCVSNSAANACPFCSSTAQTLRQDMESMDVVALAELAKPSEADIDGTGLFRLTKIWRGEKVVGDKKTVEAPYFGPGKSEKKFLMLGGGTDEVLWSSPLPVSPSTEAYLEEVSKLPEESAVRLRSI